MLEVAERANVESCQKPTFGEPDGNDRFVPKGVALPPRCRETLSLSSMPDKRAFSDRVPGTPTILACRKHTVFRHPQNYSCSRFTPRFMTLFYSPVAKVVVADRPNTDR